MGSPETMTASFPPHTISFRYGPMLSHATFSFPMVPRCVLSSYGAAAFPVLLNFWFIALPFSALHLHIQSRALSTRLMATIGFFAGKFIVIVENNMLDSQATRSRELTDISIRRKTKTCIDFCNGKVSAFDRLSKQVSETTGIGSHIVLK
jgi:hypothetical protein